MINQTEKESTSKGEINSTLQSQIFSMLKDVIDEDQTSDYSQEFGEKIFSSDGEGDEDIKMQKTHCLFNGRQNKNKPKTTQQTNPLMSKQNPFNNSNDFKRNNFKKFQTTQFQPSSQNNPPVYVRSTPYHHLRYTYIHPNPYQQQNGVFIPSKKRFNTMIIQNPIQLYQSETYLAQLEVNLFQKKKIDMVIYQELIGKIAPIIQVQKGARILLTYIENTSKEVLNAIYEELKAKLTFLLLDQYANRFCMKLFFELNPQSRMEYLKTIANALILLSINKISTYPIQFIVENVHTIPEKEIIAKAFQSCYMKLALDTYGTHVLEKMVLCFDYYFIRELSGFVSSNFLLFATNANGLCVVKKIIIIEYKKDLFIKIQTELIKNSIALIQDPYGNYALQIAIDNWELADIEEIINTFKGKAVMLSNQKYSSNVIERCFEKSESYMSSYIAEICEDSKTFLKIIKNNYGNYVLQTALKIASKQDQDLILKLIECTIDQLPEKKRINKWKRILCGYKSQPSILPSSD